MKLFPGISIALLLLISAAACKKDRGPEPAAPGTWSVSGKTYTAAKTDTLWQNSHITGDPIFCVVLTAYDADTNRLRLSFTKPPEAEKQYKLVRTPRSEGEASIEHWSARSRGGGSQDHSVQYLEVSTEGAGLRYLATEIKVQEYTFVSDYMTPLSLNVSQ